MSSQPGLSRRERQIMDILFQRGKASASEVRQLMEDTPSYSAVRTLLRVLEEKGHVRHRAEGLRYVYAGNLPGRVGRFEDTRCSHCSTTLIRRFSYQIEDYRITPAGTCPDCGTAIPGRWAPEFRGQLASHPFLPHRASGLVTIAHRR